MSLGLTESASQRVRNWSTVWRSGTNGRPCCCIQRATSLDENEAKTLVYYAMATYGLPQLQKFPILSLKGPNGTGKSTLQGILEQIVYRPRKIDGDVSDPALRDSLMNTPTALIEEADQVTEKLLIKRYARQSSKMVVKRPRGETWKQESIDLFGATVLHRRRPFRSQELGGSVPFRRRDPQTLHAGFAAPGRA